MVRRARHLAAVCLIVAVVAVALVVTPRLAAREPWVEGERLEFALPDLDGSLVRSSDPRFQERVLLVELWATWCPPCLSEIPTLIELSHRYRELGLVVVGIAFEAEEEADERRSRLAAFGGEKRIDYLILDGGTPKELAASLPRLRDVGGLPVEILVGTDGRVKKTRNGYGYSKRWARRLDRTIRSLLAAGESEARP